MHKHIHKLYTKTQKQADYYWCLFNTLSAEQLLFKPSLDSWSIAQVVDHLYKVDKQTYQFLVNFDFDRKNQVLGVKERINSLLLKISLRSRRRFRVPKNAEINPFIAEEKIYPETIKAEWLNLRDKMKRFLESFPEDKHQHFVFVHPVVGKLNILQTLGFLDDHLYHHRRQVKRIKNHPAFPKRF
ncbi:DinB family protein [Cytophagales bacterium LB-30]|uniref:DinB family protein n=1 Tax=Shiella aurantiaca TaxID=3058365 RepID=A0ABT8F4S4_9BACT|nr:DinB family protein [Shiella aurantiaca]MDN4165364.1 DinB family protein [Shiella aurantiaca]